MRECERERERETAAGAWYLSASQNYAPPRDRLFNINLIIRRAREYKNSRLGEWKVTRNSPAYTFDPIQPLEIHISPRNFFDFVEKHNSASALFTRYATENKKKKKPKSFLNYKRPSTENTCVGQSNARSDEEVYKKQNFACIIYERIRINGGRNIFATNAINARGDNIPNNKYRDVNPLAKATSGINQGPWGSGGGGGGGVGGSLKSPFHTYAYIHARLYTFIRVVHPARRFTYVSLGPVYQQLNATRHYTHTRALGLTHTNVKTHV